MYIECSTTGLSRPWYACFVCGVVYVHRVLHDWIIKAWYACCVCGVVYVHRLPHDWIIKAVLCLFCLWDNVCTSSAPRTDYQGVVCLLCLWGSVCTSSVPRLQYQGRGMSVVSVW